MFWSLSCLSWPATSGLAMTLRTCSAASASCEFFSWISALRASKSTSHEVGRKEVSGCGLPGQPAGSPLDWTASCFSARSLFPPFNHLITTRKGRTKGAGLARVDLLKELAHVVDHVGLLDELVLGGRDRGLGEKRAVKRANTRHQLLHAHSRRQGRKETDGSRLLR
jgi:hypothetical protein